MEITCPKSTKKCLMKMENILHQKYNENVPNVNDERRIINELIGINDQPKLSSKCASIKIIKMYKIFTHLIEIQSLYSRNVPCTLAWKMKSQF